LSILWTTESGYATERRKWEATHTEFGPPGRPFTFHEYPLMVYQASRPSTGGPPVLVHEIVHDEPQERQLASRGYVRGPDHAVAQLDAQELEIAKLAAERHYDERRMSARAQAEASAVDDSTIDHVPSVPEMPIRRGPGRPRKEEIES
jgi:hypothetical protein